MRHKINEFFHTVRRLVFDNHGNIVNNINTDIENILKET